MSSNVRMENDDRENIHDIPMQPSVNSSKLLIKFAIEQQWQIKEVTGLLSLEVWRKEKLYFSELGTELTAPETLPWFISN